MPTPLTTEETQLIADALRSHAKLVEKLAEHDLVPGDVDLVVAIVPATMEALARRVEEQTDESF